MKEKYTLLMRKVSQKYGNTIDKAPKDTLTFINKVKKSTTRLCQSFYRILPWIMYYTHGFNEYNAIITANSGKKNHISPPSMVLQ
ncbi:MAG: hypothetical protein IPK11_12685 [Ignavibacteria bacterium]|nr:hypothetical protein [Ignavibacteria bacterium]